VILFEPRLALNAPGASYHRGDFGRKATEGIDTYKAVPYGMAKADGLSRIEIGIRLRWH
jgi:hypothetical protein